MKILLRDRLTLFERLEGTLSYMKNDRSNVNSFSPKGSQEILIKMEGGGGRGYREALLIVICIWGFRKEALIILTVLLGPHSLASSSYIRRKRRPTVISEIGLHSASP
jgi:hypothetical protein